MVQLPARSADELKSQELAPDPIEPAQDDWDWNILSEEWLSDEPALESDLHRNQIDLLLRLMRWHWRDQDDIYYSGNTTVYYDPLRKNNRIFRGPDLYVVLDTDPRQRRSWMVWREGGKYPDFVIEILSDETAEIDRTEKKKLYQNVWHLPNYFWFHPYTYELRGFRLVGRSYREIQPNHAGHLWSDALNLFLGVHEGVLRLFTEMGELVLLEEEAIREMLEFNRQRVEREQKEVDRARQRADQLARQLRELGVDPDEVDCSS